MRQCNTHAVTNNDHLKRVLAKHVDKKFHRFMPNNLVADGVDVFEQVRNALQVVALLMTMWVCFLCHFILTFWECFHYECAHTYLLAILWIQIALHKKDTSEWTCPKEKHLSSTFFRIFLNILREVKSEGSRSSSTKEWNIGSWFCWWC
jgi:hypothetical protein